MGIGAFRAFTGEFMGGLWLVLIGLFLRQAAEGSYQQVVLRRALGPLAVRDVMTREVVHVPADLPVGRVLDEFFWRHHVSSFPVLDGERVVGILGLDQLRQVSSERLAETRSREIMRPLAEGLTAAPGDSLWQAFESRSERARTARRAGRGPAGGLPQREGRHARPRAPLGPRGPALRSMIVRVPLKIVPPSTAVALCSAATEPGNTAPAWATVRHRLAWDAARTRPLYQGRPRPSGLESEAGRVVLDA